MTPLHSLCKLAGIQTHYVDDRHQLVEVSDAVLRQVLELVVPEASSPEKQYEKLQQHLRLKTLSRPLPRVWVAWNGKIEHLTVNVPQRHQNARLELLVEGGAKVIQSWILSDHSPSEKHRVGNESYQTYLLPWKTTLEFGYHRFQLVIEGADAYPTLVIAAPLHANPSPAPRKWGLFSPLYALRSEADEGIGTLNELQKMQQIVGQAGGHFVGTLPLLASTASDPSPYSPSSRLFWNDIFLGAEPGKTLDAAEIEALRRQTTVNYQRIGESKRKFFQASANEFFKNIGQSPEAAQWELFLNSKPQVLDFARFQSQNLEEQNRELYVQFQIHRLLTENRKKAQSGEMAGLYLDFPIGVNPKGFDAHYYPQSFLKGATMGAPPDAFFSKGQNWGTLAFSPEGLFETGFEAFIQSIRNHVQYGSMLRLDHVMGLHRLFMIPEGQNASQGAYVQYPHSELYAIICLEAYRHRCTIVGEDLGTVAQNVRSEMDHHRFKRMWIYELEFDQAPRPVMQQIPEHSLASLNTHDLLPFAAFWKKTRDQKPEVAREWLTFLNLGEKATIEEIFRALSLKIAESKSEIFLLNLEDLWGETEPQNLPGVVDERIWRKKNKLPIEEWSRQPEIVNLFARLKEVRA